MKKLIDDLVEWFLVLLFLYLCFRWDVFRGY